MQQRTSGSKLSPHHSVLRNLLHIIRLDIQLPEVLVERSPPCFPWSPSFSLATRWYPSHSYVCMAVPWSSKCMSGKLEPSFRYSAGQWVGLRPFQYLLVCNMVSVAYTQNAPEASLMEYVYLVCNAGRAFPCLACIQCCW